MQPASLSPVGRSPADVMPNTLRLNQLEDPAHYAKPEIISLLAQTYGQRLASDVLERCDALRDQVQGSEVKQLLVSVAALVKKQDLQETFEEIRKGQGRDCLRWLAPSQIKQISSKNSFEQLGNKELIWLRDLYCKVHHADGISEPIAEAYFPQAEVSRETAFGKHLKMIRACELGERYVQSDEVEHFELRQKLAGEEHLARTLSYNLPNQEAMNMIVPILNEQGETILCEVRGIVEEKGLYFFVFLPLTQGQWQKQADTPCPVWYAFRGTNDLEAWKRNLTEGTFEAGRYSYAQHEPKILRCVLSCLPLGPYTLTGTGHSLAGAEASRMVRTLFTYAARGQQGLAGELEEGAIKALSNLREIKLVTWNTASLVWDTLQSYNQSRKLFPEVTVRPYHNYVDEDFVPQCGFYMLGHRYYDDDHDDQPKLTKYKLRELATSVGTTWTAHTTPLLLDNARVVEILPIPQDQVNYKLGPRGALPILYACCAGIFKNMWRARVGTQTLVAGAVKVLRGKQIAQVPVNELRDDDFVIMEREQIPPQLMEQAKPVILEHEHPAGEQACSKGSHSS